MSFLSKKKKHLAQILYTNNIRTNAYIKIYMATKDARNKIGDV